MRRFLPVLLVAVAALAGCTGSGDDDGTTPPPPPVLPPLPPPPTLGAPAKTTESFDGSEAGAPSGWVAYRGTWDRQAGSGDGHGTVLRGVGNDELNTLLAVPAGSHRDFTAEVTFQVVSGEHPNGAGLAFHFQDNDNYQIVRYSTSENGWNIFTVHQGQRDKHKDATLDGSPTHDLGEWVTVRVESRGGVVEAYEGEQRFLSFTLPPEVAQSGGIGPFVRGSTTTVLFDGFSVEAL